MPYSRNQALHRGVLLTLVGFILAAGELARAEAASCPEQPGVVAGCPGPLNLLLFGGGVLAFVGLLTVVYWYRVEPRAGSR